MSTNEESEVGKTGHVYDGIEELDHPTPNWFQFFFYLSVLFGLGYFCYYTLGPGPSLIHEYHQAKLADEYSFFERQAKTGGPQKVSEDVLLSLVKDPIKVKLGASVFQSKCVSCHGAQGQGGIGPNLTDDYWIHGGKLTEILETITNGVLDKGMPPWGSVLKPEEIQAVTAFVRSIRGTNPPGAKESQGVLVKIE